MARPESICLCNLCVMNCIRKFDTRKDLPPLMVHTFFANKTGCNEVELLDITKVKSSSTPALRKQQANSKPIVVQFKYDNFSKKVSFVLSNFASIRLPCVTSS
jgi:hypothetical protein